MAKQAGSKMPPMPGSGKGTSGRLPKGDSPSNKSTNFSGKTGKSITPARDRGRKG